MSSSRLIKRRIKSAKNISQITKAMEMVSASKMKRAQDQALMSRPYAEKLADTLQTVATYSDPSLHPLLQSNTSEKSLLIVISSDRGLAGALNTTLIKKVDEHLQTVNCDVIVVGKKAKEFAQKFGHNIVAEFVQLPDRISLDNTIAISQFVIDSFTKKAYSSVYTAHMKFLSTLSQRVQITQLLPLSYDSITETTEQLSPKSEYTFEPDPKTVLSFLLPYYVEMIVYQTVLDSKASEHSARMVAMKNASDNAKEIVNELQLVYNKSRQASITNELLDMTTATMSIAS